MQNSESVNYTVQLIDAGSGELLGEFDNVTFQQGNIFQYNNIGYQVNTNGIGSRTVRLRLVVNANFNANYSLTQRFDTEPVTGLGKDSRVRKQITFTGMNPVNEYALEQNYPNPFNPVTTISYAVPKEGNVTMTIYDALGKEVATLVDERKVSGRYTVQFNASTLASGMYMYKLVSGKYSSVKKMVVVK